MSDFFDDDFFNNGSNNDYNYSDISERDKLELDDDLKHSRKEDAMNNKRKWGFSNHGHDGYGDFGGEHKRTLKDRISFKRNRGMEGNGNGGLGKSSWGALIVVILVMLGIFAVTNGGFISSWRSKNSTMQEKTGTLIDSFRNFNSASNRAQKKIETGKEQKIDPIYDVNNIYDDDYISQKPEKQYLVFAYTGVKEDDKPFAKWILENESKYKIYRVKQGQMGKNGEAVEYLNGKPLMYIYNEPTTNYKVLDGVVDDADLLDEVGNHMDELIKDKKENGIPTTRKDYEDKNSTKSSSNK